MAEVSSTLGNTMGERKEKIDSAKELIHSTRDLYDKYAKDVLRSNWERFEPMEKSLEASEARIVVVGEFSRGKSTLLNALLNMRTLPTANFATTAINTFVHGLKKGEGKNWFNIVYRNGKQDRLESEGDDGAVLRKWGTELDKEHKSARREVELIEYHKDHPLLNNGLILIDTPGLESTEKHHKEITHRAIDSAHIAIWLLSAEQLGGDEHEWKFHRETLRKNFRKFLIVVTHWDKVLEPEDDYGKTLSRADRIKDAREHVRDKLRETHPELSEEEVKIITGDRNLFGVCSLWALSDDEERRKDSGIEALASRLAEMCGSGEAMEEIFYKPLTQLNGMQNDLKEQLESNIDALDNGKSFEDQERDIKSLQQEIKDFEFEQKNANHTSLVDHERHRDQALKDLENLTAPLLDLKGNIEDRVTKKYVRERIRSRDDSIGLPPDLQREYERCMGECQAGINEARASIEKRLEQLRLDYENSMSRHMNKMREVMGSLKIELPELNVNFTPDFSEIERFYRDKAELEEQLDYHQRESERLEAEITENAEDRRALQAAKDAVERAERRIMELGPEPAPNRYYKTEKIKDGGTWGKDEYGDVPYEDRSNVEHYRKRLHEYENMLNNREDAEAELIAREQAKTGRRMTAEAARRNVEKKLKRMEAELEEMRQNAEQSEAEQVEDIHARLLSKTAGQLDSQVRAIDKNLKEAVRGIFDSHQKLLAQCVEEGVAEKMRGKQESLEQALELKKKGEAEMEARRQELADALNKLEELQSDTVRLLGE